MMSGIDWAGMIVAATGFLALLGKGVAWLLNLILQQPLNTIKELKETNTVLTKDRDYWRDRALGKTKESSE